MKQVSSASIVGCTIWEYEYVRSQVNKMMNSSMKFFQNRQQNVRKKYLMLSTWYNTKLFTQISDLKGAWARITDGKVKEAWERLSPGDQFFIPICGLNMLVFALWRIPRLQTMLLRNFCANPAGCKYLCTILRLNIC